MRTLLLLVVAASATAFEQERCKAWVENGYCTQAKFKAYMAKHCAGSCPVDESADASEPAQPAPQQPPPEAPSQPQPAPVDDDEEVSEEDAASEPADCPKWAVSGFCEEGHTHHQYMTTSCKANCKLMAAGKLGAAAAGDGQEDPKCRGWALEGHCTEGAYKDYVAVNCKRSCELVASGQLSDAPPPFGASVVLLTAAFGGVAFYAAKFAIGRDQSKIASMRGPDAVGTGKGKERSAKKRR